MRKKKRVAIFDIDGTIFRSSLLIELVDALIEERIFPANARRVYARAYANWLDRRDSYDKYIMGVIAAFDRHVKGVREKDFLRVARSVVAFHKNRVYRYTRDLVRDLKRRGYFLLAISHSPKYIVHEFARQIGFTKVYGRMLTVGGNGKFTGGILHADVIGDKEKILMRAIEKENLTLAGSIGVGDTESDIAFLKRVHRPICFNPNSILYREAKKRGWEIVVERKDVIYRHTKQR